MSPSLLPASAGVISWGLNGLFLFWFSHWSVSFHILVFFSLKGVYIISPFYSNRKKNPLSLWALHWSQTKISCSHFPLCSHSLVWSCWDERWLSPSGEHLYCSAPCDFVVFNTFLQHVTSNTQLRSSGTFGNLFYLHFQLSTNFRKPDLCLYTWHAKILCFNLIAEISPCERCYNPP